MAARGQQRHQHAADIAQRAGHHDPHRCGAVHHRAVSAAHSSIWMKTAIRGKAGHAALGQSEMEIVKGAHAGAPRGPRHRPRAASGDVFFPGKQEDQLAME